MARSSGCALVVGMLAASMGLGGCTTTVIHRVAQFEAGGAAAVAPAPETAIYKVKVAEPSGQVRNVEQTRQTVLRNDVLGFQTGADGKVQAIVNDQTIPIDAPEGSRLIWYARYQTVSPLGLSFDRGAEALKQFGAYMLGAALVAALIVLALRGDLESDDCSTAP